MPAVFRFSTAELPAQARGRAVRELRERGLVPLEPLSDRRVSVDIGKWSLPGAAILAGTLSGLRRVAGLDPSRAVDDVFLGINLAGASTAMQRGQDVGVADGDAVLLSETAGPFTIVRPTAVRFIGLRVPRATVAPLLGGADRPAMRVIPRATPALRLLATYLTGVVTSDIASPEPGNVVAVHVHDLLALTVGATRDAAAAANARGVRAARLHAIKADIVAHLEDSLTVAVVAARHGITPRYVQKLFEAEGVTYSEFVVRERLERAHRRLRDPRGAARRISDIAYDVGFGDLSYFNRAFRRHYAVTPSDVRNAARRITAAASRWPTTTRRQG
jgi:AraC-like DNA-binding protein